MKTSEVLRAAVEHIRKVSWKTDAWEGNDRYEKPCCAVNACEAVTRFIPVPGNLRDRARAWHAMADAIEANQGTRESVPTWNDRQTSAEPVIAMMLAAAEASEKAGY